MEEYQDKTRILLVKAISDDEGTWTLEIFRFNNTVEKLHKYSKGEIGKFLLDNRKILGREFERNRSIHHCYKGPVFPFEVYDPNVWSVRLLKVIFDGNIERCQPSYYFSNGFEYTAPMCDEEEYLELEKKIGEMFPEVFISYSDEFFAKKHDDFMDGKKVSFSHEKWLRYMMVSKSIHDLERMRAPFNFTVPDETKPRDLSPFTNQSPLHGSSDDESDDENLSQMEHVD